MLFLVATTSVPVVFRPNDNARTTTAGTPHTCANLQPLTKMSFKTEDHFFILLTCKCHIKVNKSAGQLIIVLCYICLECIDQQNLLPGFYIQNFVDSCIFCYHTPVERQARLESSASNLLTLLLTGFFTNNYCRGRGGGFRTQKLFSANSDLYLDCWNNC